MAIGFAAPIRPDDATFVFNSTVPVPITVDPKSFAEPDIGFANGLMTGMKALAKPPLMQVLI